MKDGLNNVNKQRAELLELRKAAQEGQNVEQRAPEVQAPQGKEKINHFMYYYKWYLIAAVALVILVVSIILTFVNKEKYDLTVILSTETTVSEQMRLELVERLESYAEDFDGNGEISVQVLSLPFVAAKNDVPQSVEYQNRMKLVSELSTATTVLLISDEGKYEFLQQKEFLHNFEPDYPNNELVHEGRFLLDGTDLAQGDLAEILEGTALSIRTRPNKFTHKSDELNYENSLKVLKKIIEGNVK